MTLGSEGVIQDPTIELLKDTINIILDGGRVFKINNETNYKESSFNNSYGFLITIKIVTFFEKFFLFNSNDL